MKIYNAVEYIRYDEKEFVFVLNKTSTIKKN